MRRIRRSELPLDTVELARYLIGKLIVSHSPEGRCAGRIVETEAYLADDPSSHSYRGKTARNASMFLRRGHAYVYFIYGSSHCLNVAADRPGVGAAVLLRALDPLFGLELMADRRGRTALRELTRGPGRLAQALGVDRNDDGVDLCSGTRLRLAEDDASAPVIAESVRIGISKERERLHRFFDANSPFISGPGHLCRGIARR